jgi:hypothetical protein
VTKHSWSFSAIKDFKGCSRRYHAVRVAKLYKSPKTEAIIYGEQVHKALEEYVRDSKPLPAGFDKFKSLADSVLRFPGAIHCELKMALNADKQPVAFRDKDVWVRGIADVLVVDGPNAHVLDYKTGGAKYPDKDQLELMALMTFAYFPEVETVKGALAFVAHDVLIKSVYKRQNIAKMWAKWDAGSALLDKAYELDKWHPNPTPLCRWCPHEACEHWVR